MKKLQNNFTTPEQSKRLLELGVPADSADCFIAQYSDGGYCPLPGIINDEFQDREWLMRIGIPCWSVGRLAQITLICSGSSKVGMMFKSKDTDLIESFIDDIHLLKEFGRLDFSKLNDK